MVIVHPEYALLILEVNELKEQIADLVVEKDMLRFYTCKDLEIDYILKIGALEYKMLVADNCYEKNLRKLKLIEEKQEKKLLIDIKQIDKQISREFKKQDKAEKQMSKEIDLAIEMTELERLDIEQLDEMNMSYFKLQKLYNPILDEEPSEDKIKMYQKIEKYYQKGNFKKLQQLTKAHKEEEIFQDEIDSLKKLREQYIKSIKEIQKEIRKIKCRFPYNQKVILNDEILCRRKKDNLNREIIEINLQNKKIEKKIQKKL